VIFLFSVFNKCNWFGKRWLIETNRFLWYQLASSKDVFEEKEKYIRAIIKAMNLCRVKKYLHEPPEFETIAQKAD